MTKTTKTILTLSLIALICTTMVIVASSADARVADAAMKGDKAAIRSLLKEAADVNAAQGDGMTALHWAAMNADAELTQTLLYAGANVKASTRLGGLTPLMMAAKSGAAPVIDILLKAGADPKGKATDGLTSLMMAAMAGDRDSVRLLLEHGAEVNAKETDHGQTAMIFAAGFNRPDAIDELLKHGADINLSSEVQTPPAPPAPVPAPAAPAGRGAAPAPVAPAAAGARGVANAAQAPAGTGPGAPATAGAAAAAPPPGGRGVANPHGGLTPLMYSAREGHMEAVRTLVEHGAKLDEKTADKSTAVLLASINGHFDVAKYLVEHRADVNIASVDGNTPLYAVVHTQWPRKSFHPQPTKKYESTSYLELMKVMLDFGANPNARLSKELWYTSYGYAFAAASAVGATPFWKCAEVADLDGMKLLLSKGADPTVVNKDGVNPLLVASGAGTHGNDDVMAPAGRLAAVKFLVEELHADINASDNGVQRNEDDMAAQQGNRQAQAAAPPAAAVGQPPAVVAVQAQANQFGGQSGAGYTALHNAASRGDNQMILYLVSKGARVDAVTKSGISVVDMANGPRQRVQPYPETVALLEMLGSKNSHKCQSC